MKKQESANAAVEALLARRVCLATAESCTGGGIGQAITSIAGSSAVYGYGIISYSNEAKQRILQVPAQILEEFGAVSEQTAEAMLKGVLALSGADYALAVTGIAGPGGGSEEKPVGLVYIGCANARGDMLIRRQQFPGDRTSVREQTVNYALALLLEMMEDN